MPLLNEADLRLKGAIAEADDEMFLDVEKLSITSLLRKYGGVRPAKFIAKGSALESDDIGSPVRAQLDTPTPILPPLEIPDDTPLEARYDIIVHGIQKWLIQVWPLSVQRYPSKILLPATLEEYIEITNDPERGDHELYAGAKPNQATSIYAPNHQKDMRKFVGALDAKNKKEVSVIKAIAHEMVHLSNPVYYKGEVEEVSVECSTETCAMVFVGQHMPCSGSREDLWKMLVDNASYKNRIELWSEMMVALTGSAQDALELCKTVVYSDPDDISEYIASCMEQKFGIRQPDTFDLLKTKSEDYDDGLRSIVSAVTNTAKAVRGKDTPGTLLWLISNSRLL